MFSRIQVAKMLDMPEMRVYEVATFYTMFNRHEGTFTRVTLAWVFGRVPAGFCRL